MHRARMLALFHTVSVFVIFFTVILELQSPLRHAPPYAFLWDLVCFQTAQSLHTFARGQESVTTNGLPEPAGGHLAEEDIYHANQSQVLYVRPVLPVY